MRAFPLLLVLTGCLRWLPAPIPMGKVEDPGPGGPAKCLVVLLPGAGDRAATFREERFVELLHAAGLSLDVVSADSTMGYYFKGLFEPRLELDVIGPARAKAGYAETWLIGISMGGFGALHYASLHSAQVSGILALAPYLGPSRVTDEIRAAGGLPGWKRPELAPVTEDNHAEQLWGWLQVATSGQQPGPALYLGYGDDDALGDDAGLLSSQLPAGHVFHAPGGHDWPPWRALLAKFLESSDFKVRCAR